MLRSNFLPVRIMILAMILQLVPAPMGAFAQSGEITEDERIEETLLLLLGEKEEDLIPLYEEASVDSVKLIDLPDGTAVEFLTPPDQNELAVEPAAEQDASTPLEEVTDEQAEESLTEVSVDEVQVNEETESNPVTVLSKEQIAMSLKEDEFIYVSFEDEETQEFWIGFVESSFVYEFEKGLEVLEARVMAEEPSETETPSPEQSEEAAPPSDDVTDDGTDQPAKEEDQTETVEEPSTGEADSLLEEEPASEEVTETPVTEEPEIEETIVEEPVSEVTTGESPDEAAKEVVEESTEEAVEEAPAAAPFSRFSTFSTFSTVQSVPSIRGIAVADRVNVYATKSRSANVLTTYMNGDMISYHSLVGDWHETTVTVGGRQVTGFINRVDVDEVVDAKNTNGFAAKNVTNVYESTAANAKVLQGFTINTRMTYRTFTRNWHEVTVIINGKSVTGYVKATDVRSTQTSLSAFIDGTASKATTNVFSGPSGSTPVLRTYPRGTALQVQQYNSRWYILTVYIGGVAKSGYIHVNDFDQKLTTKSFIDGRTSKNPTNIFSSASGRSSIVTKIPQGTAIQYQPFNDSWFTTTVTVSGRSVTGYIHRNDVEQAAAFQETLNGRASKSPTNVFTTASGRSKVVTTIPQGTAVQYKLFTTDWYQVTVNNTIGYVHRNDMEKALTNQSLILGRTSKNPTNVFTTASGRSAVLQTVTEGSALQYRKFTNDWYEVKVDVNGKLQTGYIHRNDMQQTLTSQSAVTGRTTKHPTNVFTTASGRSRVVQTIPQGTAVQYRKFTNDWYETTITVNGRAVIGYLHRNDVEQTLTGQPLTPGRTSKFPTNVFATASGHSAVVQTIPQGTAVQYMKFTNDWYSITYNGKLGYIHRNDVEQALTSQPAVTARTILSPTNLYTTASGRSAVMQAIPEGAVIQYRKFTNDWYSVTYNGKTGYVHRNDVEAALTSQPTLTGRASKNPTNMYSITSSRSSVTQTIPEGTAIQYRLFTKDWYVVTYNGKTGYVTLTDIEKTISSPKNENAITTKSPTNIFTTASGKSAVLTTLPQGTPIQYRTFTASWHQVTVSVNGQNRTGYIHRNDASIDRAIINPVSYSMSFSTMVDRQMQYGMPKANGTGTISAGRNLVEYYMNPGNFPRGTSGFLQFLVLSKPANVDAAEVNTKILRNGGVLTGKAQTFINAGKQHGVNEIYLISHAMLETGNGTSVLARGQVVNGRTVYNVYGIGANDGCANSCGAQRAYSEGWFTVDAAIIGGAKFIAESYIKRGQDTLYKMKWNPASPGTRQYATHVSWAVSQTTRIANMYNQLSNHVQIFDVPNIPGTPAPSGTTAPINFIGYPAGALGVTTTSNLNFRSAPVVTNSNLITQLPNNASLQILGENGGGWYNVRYNNATGWVSADYVRLQNVLEVRTSGLNVRNTPVTGTSVGVVSTGMLVIGNLDSKGNFIKNGAWYSVRFNNTNAWISSGTNNNYLAEKR